MSTRMLDGQAIAAEIQAEVKARVERLKRCGCAPGLRVVLVGDDPASLSYIGAKARAAQDSGIACEVLRLPADSPQLELLEVISRLNERADTHGILVQQPLPPQIDPAVVSEAVHPDKDVDGLHPCNLGWLLAGAPRFVPCTAAGIVELLLRTGNDPAGKRVVVIGRSSLVGKPLAALLMQRGRGGDATVTVCHTQTVGLAAIARTADILVAAAGRPGFVTGGMVREGAVVVDVGINRIADPSRRRGYRIAGDVDAASVAGKAAALTPVPGGVGPMTVAMLLANTARAAELHVCTPVGDAVVGYGRPI